MMARPAGRSRAARLLLLLSLGASAGCASAGLPPPPDAPARAAATQTYSARLRVSLRGPTLRARAPILLAFARPDRLRIELPGPSGARLIAVTRDGRLTAVFPGERAVYQGEATPADLEALLGVSLTPGEVIDLLLGVASPRLSRYDARWGPDLPRRIDATLPDGARLQLNVEDAERGVTLAPEAFADPPHSGYRAVDMEEARSLWTR